MSVVPPDGTVASTLMVFPDVMVVARFAPCAPARSAMLAETRYRRQRRVGLMGVTLWSLIDDLSD